MLIIGPCIPEKLGSYQNSACSKPIGFESKSLRHGLDSGKDIFGPVVLPLFNQDAQVDDGRS
jgi:hypothetical protein